MASLSSPDNKCHRLKLLFLAMNHASATCSGPQGHAQWWRTKSRSKKYIIGGSYIVGNVSAVRFRNSWRKNMALGSFGILEKYCISGVFWPFLVFLGAIFTQPCCFRVFWALHMTSTHPRHLPDTLRYHPDTARHPQTPSRHPHIWPAWGHWEKE